MGGKGRAVLAALAAALLLTGCAWMEGSFVSISAHQQQSAGAQADAISAKDYWQLRQVMESLVQDGMEKAVIDVSEYPQENVAGGMESVIGYICQSMPLGTYAVEKIGYEVGNSGGHPAVSVEIAYIHGRSEIRKIQTVPDMGAAQKAIVAGLEECAEGLVLQIEDYEEMDLAQMVEDYAQEHPNTVMEVPQVAVGVYPERGPARVLELKFSYQTSRDALRQMQTQVERAFGSAALYTNADATDMQKCSQLYTFLMERSEYKLETSITPSYSLLVHGVGDSEAFASVYGAMCRQAGLDCRTVSGTRQGESWYWNLLQLEGQVYHVDLLRCSEQGSFLLLTEQEMDGYVWDYSAYPAQEAQGE